MTDIEDQFDWATASLRWTQDGYQLDVPWVGAVVEDSRRDKLIAGKILDEGDSILPAKANRVGILRIGLGVHGLVVVAEDLLQCPPARVRATVEQAAGIALQSYSQTIEREDAQMRDFLHDLAPERWQT